MSETRKPAAFRIEAEPMPPEPEPPRPGSRTPRALAPSGGAVVTPAEIDVFDEADAALAEPPPALRPRRRSRLAAVFFSAVGILVSLAIGLWTDRLIHDLFSRADWLGWAATGVASIALLALLLIVLREMLALARLASVERLRKRAREASERNDARAARRLTDELADKLASKPQTAAGRRALAELRGDIIDGADLIRLAETELLAPLDTTAQKMILDAAKRVSLVTAVSPRAVADVAYVVFEAGRLIRRLAELYGGRPGTLGFFRLARDVLAHLAVTGSIAIGDSFVQQIVGHGLAAKLSAKLGEGVVNGMMTARIGMAAMDTVRPLPFSAVRRPRLSDFLTALASFARKQESSAATETN